MDASKTRMETSSLKRDEIARRWTQYIKSLYSDQTRSKPEEFENPEGPEILIEEVTKESYKTS